MERTIDGIAEIKHDAAQTNHCLETDTGRAQFGATKHNDLLCITNRNGRSTFCSHDRTGHGNLAGNRQDDDLLIKNREGKTTIRNIGKKFFTKTVVKHVNHTPNIWAAAILAVATLIPLPSLADTPRTVQAWGGNSSGDLGIGVASFGETLPREVVNLNDVKTIAGGNLHSLALLTDGTARAWGFNQQGQLGNGTTSGSEVVPVEVKRIIGVESVAAGTHSLALLSNGRVAAWGANNFGQLGNGSFSDSDIPTAVLGLPFESGGGRVIAIAAGHAHSLALLDDGTVLAWGRNIDGQLCDGTKVNRTTPVKSLFHNVKAISAGETVSLALLADGTVRAAAAMWANSAMATIVFITQRHRCLCRV